MFSRSNFHFLICCDALLLDMRKGLTWEHGLIPQCSDWGVHLSWANIPSLHFHLTKYQWRIKRYRILVLKRTAHHGPEDAKSKKKILIGCDLPITFTHLTKVSRTPPLNEKIDSGNTHLQDLAQWWRTSKGLHIPKISQFYWGLFEKTRFLCFYIIKSMARKGYFGPKSDFRGSKIPPRGASSTWNM